MRLRGELHKVDMIIAQMSLDTVVTLGGVQTLPRAFCVLCVLLRF